MNYRHLGRSGLSVSEISVGSWLTFGSSVDRERTREIVHRAFDLGINFFDTADVYANGGGEEVLGAALKELPRRYVVIASKCFFPMSERSNDRGLSRKHVFESVEASLRRLGTDYLDLHQCHRADPSTPMEETVCDDEKGLNPPSRALISWKQPVPAAPASYQDHGKNMHEMAVVTA